jgi:hypothetical protein
LRRNSRVGFSNLDSTRGQVYSFSRVKRFMTRLYAGREAELVIIDRVGLVPIGCHDAVASNDYDTIVPALENQVASGADHGVVRLTDVVRLH